MRGCALRKVVRNLAHKKLENRGVADSPNRAAAPACVSHCFSHKQWLAQEVAEDAEDAEFCRGPAVYMAGGSGSRTPKMVEGLPWVPDRPTLGSRFFSGLCQVPVNKMVSGGFPRVFRFPQLLL